MKRTPQVTITSDDRLPLKLLVVAFAFTLLVLGLGGWHGLSSRRAVSHWMTEHEPSTGELDAALAEHLRAKHAAAQTRASWLAVLGLLTVSMLLLSWIAVFAAFRTHLSRRRLVEESLAKAHRDLQRQLGESEKKARVLFDSAGDAQVILDPDTGRIQDVNEEACRRFGYSREEMLGLAPQDINRSDCVARVPERLERVRTRELHCFESVYVRRDGSEFPAEVVARLVELHGRPAIFGVCRDITERKAAERRLIEQKELLGQIISNIPHFVFWKDRRAVYLGCNDQLARVAGLESADQIVGKTDYDLAWTRDEAEWYRQCDREVMERGAPMLNIEEPQLQADGSQAVLLTSKVPLRDAGGNVTGVLGIFADITAQKRAEAAHRDAAREAESRRAEVEALLHGARALLEHASFDSAARDILETCKCLIGATVGYVELAPTEGGREAPVVDSGNLKRIVDSAPTDPVGELRCRAYETGQVVYENALDEEGRPAGGFAGLAKLCNVLFAPLRREGRVIGLLGLGNKPVPVTERDARLAGAFAELATIALRNADNLERLRAGEERWAELVRYSPEGILKVDLNGTVLSVNPSAQRITGIAEEAFVGRRFNELGLFSGDGLVCAAEAFALLQRGTELEPFILPFTRADGAARFMEVTAVSVNTRTRGYIQATIRDVTERERAAEHIHLLSVALQAAAEAVVITDRQGRIEWANRAFEELTGYRCDDVMGENPRFLKSGRHPAEFYAQMWATITQGMVWSGTLYNRRKDGRIYTERMTITPVRDETAEITHFIAIKRDITQERAVESQRAQAQKLESIGQLAAGIAHEINTPTQYISDNTRFLRDRTGDLLKAVNTCRECLRDGATPEFAQRAERLEQALGELDFEFLCEEMPKAVAESLDGLEHVTRIVRAMKDFSHPGGDELSFADLNKAIESTVTVARNEWKYVAELELDLAPGLPPVPVSLGEFNQVILNLLINAAHAIEAAVGGDSGNKGRITISTRAVDPGVEIRVSDTGTGIAREHRDRIFEHFFTTKAVGKGTGQGLSMARSVIVGKHGGTLDFETEVGRGTTFIIRLPQRRAAVEET